MDATADTVSGSTNQGYDIHLWVHPGVDGSFKTLAPTAGSWIAYFNPFDLVPGTAGPAVQCEDDGDCTWVEWIVNTPPVAVNDTYTTDKNVTLNVAAKGVLTNDTDGDNDSLTAVQVGDPLHGTVTLNANGSFTYIPVTGFIGEDAFTYKANDGIDDSNIATVSIHVSDGTPPPPLPSSFYGEIHILDNAPVAGDKVEVFIPGVSTPIATVTILSDAPNLVYVANVPGDIAGTPAKEGAVEGEALTFKINNRMVAAGVWHGGTNVGLNIHPPQALPGGPYTGTAGVAISFSGSASDWGGDAITYQWDWDNDGTYDETGQNPSHTFADFGNYTVGLKVTDAQGGEGKATTTVEVGKITVTVTAEAGQGKAYGASDPILTYTSSPSGITFSGALSREAGENVGSYAITQGDLSAGSNYTIVFVSKDFSITPKSITVTADSGQSKVFGAADPVFTYTSSESVTFSGALSRDAGENVGSYAITRGDLSAGCQLHHRLCQQRLLHHTQVHHRHGGQRSEQGLRCG